MSAPLLTLVACGRSPQQSAARQSAVTRRGDAPSNRFEPRERDAGWLGVVLPRQTLELAPEISGQVEEVYVREGDQVRRGQTVAVLGATQDRQELAIAEVNLRAAEAEVSRSRLELADADNRLSSRLAMPDAFPKEEIRRSEIQKQMAEVSLEGARARAAAQQARLAQARDRLTKAEIRAPADGTVARRYVERGALAGPGQPVVRLIGDGSTIVRFAAPPEQAVSLRTGVPVTIATDVGSVRAVIEWVSPELDPPTGLLIVVATVDRTAAVKPGSVVRVHRTNAGTARREGAG
jgi:RND family efflux transporter MFP subunit